MAQPGQLMSAGGAMKIRVDAAHSVTALFQSLESPAACLVLAHGAGAGMTHPFMAAVADGLFERGVATLRFQFPAMEAGSRRPDRPSLAQATVRAAVAKAGELAPSVPLFAGGKSFGGRMTSQAEAPLPGACGLVFFGFPLHPAKKPAIERGDHLARVGVPMLFLQGTRDALAEISLLATVVRDLGDRATLVQVDQADHSFHAPARSGQSDAEVLVGMLDRARIWMQEVFAHSN
jgi:predicted alpha/beta-hydrolase family hydrolase